ncbi:MAG: phosphatidate cytidylyltransferase [Lactobacillales bacterium]|jgi:phosphatidate cytidylyltransferase|nr:phosphatidate cytidylyltransferase [Lactobacillales bacterium]
MKTRVITAVVALAVFVPIVVKGGLFIQILAALMATVGVYELFRMKNLDVRSFEGVLSILGAIFLVFPFQNYLSFLPENGSWYLFYLTVLILLGALVISKNSYTIEEAGFPVITSLYVGVGFQSFVLARQDSLQALFFALFIVWATDIGAYMFGRKFGKHKLAPEVSPNKTIEGSAGGILSAVVVAAIFLFIYPAKDTFNLSTPYILIMTVVFSIFGQFGDLVESSIKRYFDVKDSGNILPGHGGILDRFDSLLFVFPIMHLLGVF